MMTYFVGQILNPKMTCFWGTAGVKRNAIEELKAVYVCKSLQNIPAICKLYHAESHGSHTACHTHIYSSIL